MAVATRNRLVDYTLAYDESRKQHGQPNFRTEAMILKK